LAHGGAITLGGTMSLTQQTLITPLEAAEQMRVSRSTVYALVEEGTLKAIRIGQKGKRGKLLISQDEIERFLKLCRATQSIRKITFLSIEEGESLLSSLKEAEGA
jgi:excisionase family DNA binding protein